MNELSKYRNELTEIVVGAYNNGRKDTAAKLKPKAERLCELILGSYTAKYMTDAQVKAYDAAADILSELEKMVM